MWSFSSVLDVNIRPQYSHPRFDKWLQCVSFMWSSSLSELTKNKSHSVQFLWADGRLSRVEEEELERNPPNILLGWRNDNWSSFSELLPRMLLIWKLYIDLQLESMLIYFFLFLFRQWNCFEPIYTVFCVSNIDNNSPIFLPSYLLSLWQTRGIWNWLFLRIHQCLYFLPIPTLVCFFKRIPIFSGCSISISFDRIMHLKFCNFQCALWKSFILRPF